MPYEFLRRDQIKKLIEKGEDMYFECEHCGEKVYDMSIETDECERCLNLGCDVCDMLDHADIRKGIVQLICKRAHEIVSIVQKSKNVEINLELLAELDTIRRMAQVMPKINDI